MKQYLPFLQTAVVLAVLLFAGACSLQRYDDCVTVASFTIIQDTTCRDVCAVTFKNTSTGNTDLVYYWTFGDNAYSDESNPTHTYQYADTFTVTLRVDASDGCPPAIQQDEVIILGSAVPPPVAKFTADKTTCVASPTCSFTFTNESTGNITGFEWRFDGAKVDTTRNLTRSFSQPDTIIVTLVAKGPGGESESAPVTIIIRPVTFNRLLNDFDMNTSNIERIYGVDQAGNGGYYALMNNRQKCYLIKTDAQGIPLSTPSAIGLNVSVSLLEGSTFIKLSNGYLLAGTAVYPMGQPDMFLLRLNASFEYNSIERVYGTQNKLEIGRGVTAIDNNNYLLCGRGEHSYGTGAYFIKTNSSLITLNDYYPLAPTGSEVAWSVVKVANEYWVAGKVQNGPSGTMESCFFRLNSDFQSTGDKIFMGSSFEITKIVPVNAQQAVLIGNDGGAGRLVLLNINGIMGDRAFSAWKFEDGMQAADGRLVLVGSITAGSNKQAAWATYDFQSDKFLSMAYPPPAACSQCTSGTATAIAGTSDGGFIIGASGNSNTTLFSVLIKTDRNGLIDP